MSIHYIGFYGKTGKIILSLDKNHLSSTKKLHHDRVLSLLIMGISKTNLGEHFQEYEQVQVNIRSEKKYLTCYRNFPKFSITLYS